MKKKKTQPKQEKRHKKGLGLVLVSSAKIAWPLFLAPLLVGYLTLQNIQVSMQLLQPNTTSHNDNNEPHRSMGKKRTRGKDDDPDKEVTTTTNSSSASYNNNSIPSFPRWSDPNGISWKAIEEYIRMADQDLDHSRDLLDCPKGVVVCVHDAPNVLYIFGGRASAFSSSTNNNNTTTTPKVYVERRRRKLVGPGFAKRYPIVEELMHRSLDYLLTTTTTTNNDNNNFPRLRKLLLQSSSSSSSSSGIPLILNLGDNQQCFQKNLKKAAAGNDNDSSTYLHSVPVFTLAVPFDCHYAFPIPHPAALDTAKIYGKDWPSIQRRRQTIYPISQQIQQAVWRGSPTGNKKKQHKHNLRQRLVYHANTPPKDDDIMAAVTAVTTASTTANETETIFDVGFGKHYHKIVPSYQGPMIRRKEKLFFEDFGKYAVILDVDGSSWSERFPSLVCLQSSVTAKLRPHYVDWLWPTLQASKHYIDINIFFDDDNEEEVDDSSNTTRRLWSLVASLLQNETQRKEILHETKAWCEQHMVYPQMIHDFLTSLEFYVQQLDKGDDYRYSHHHNNNNPKHHPSNTTTTSWYDQWDQLLRYDMPPEHHHWQALPVEEAKPYFGLWRD